MTPIGRHFNTLLLLAFFAFAPALGQLAAAQSALGHDVAFQWYEDADGSMTVDQFVALPDDQTRTSDRVVSLGYTRSALWVRFFAPVGEQARWLQLRPSFSDDVTLFYRPGVERGTGDTPHPWVMRHAGDQWPQARGDIDYRFPVFVLPALGAADNETGARPSKFHTPPGYDVVVRVQSTSAVLLQASLWSPGAFVQASTTSTAFWGFYFGLAAFSSILALIAAIYLRRRLVWALLAFSLSYWLVACIQGFIDWMLRPHFVVIQHYLTGILTLLTYTSLLWLVIEALDLRRHHPRLNRLMWCIIGLNLFLQVSIPFDFYALAIDIQAIVFITTAVVLAFSAWSIWRDAQSGVMTLVVGLMPMLYVVAGLLALASLFGWIPYNETVYGLWQYVIMLNMFTVLAWVAFLVRQESRQAQNRVQLARELDIEREASFHQRQFIGMVAHEFRNPLAVISSALENLQLKSISDAQRRRRYRNMRLATNRLVQLTDNCLADSRLNAEGLTLQCDKVNVLDIVRSATEVVDRSERHRWHLSVNGETASNHLRVDIPVVADQAMLRIALSNLLDNAVKYSEQGSVDIDVTTRLGSGQAKAGQSGAEEDVDAMKGHVVCISVRDHGKGVAAADADIIFERYRRHASQEGRAGVNDPGGTGLGLYVARQIARAHGGDLVLAYSSAQGSCFQLTLPGEP
ncbi:MAG TPA: histidine kinase [Pusillimonas sp.]|nr:histidine kinase [Pusillimonas sp.]